MNMQALVFLFLSFSIFKAMVLLDANPEVLDFPTLEVPTASFLSFGDCTNGIGDALACIAKGFLNIAIGVIFIIEFVIVLIVFLALVVFKIAEIQVTGVEGIPSWANALLATFFAINLGLMLYALFRKGESDAS